jgi:ribosomal protein L7Ae-like RNA K-turn-binding protein
MPAMEIIWVDSMRKLGDACAIDVAASVAALLS